MDKAYHGFRFVSGAVYSLRLFIQTFRGFRRGQCIKCIAQRSHVPDLIHDTLVRIFLYMTMVRNNVFYTSCIP